MIFKESGKNYYRNEIIYDQSQLCLGKGHKNFLTDIPSYKIVPSVQNP